MAGVLENIDCHRSKDIIPFFPLLTKRSVESGDYSYFMVAIERLTEQFLFHRVNPYFLLFQLPSSKSSIFIYVTALFEEALLEALFLGLFSWGIVTAN